MRPGRWFTGAVVWAGTGFLAGLDHDVMGVALFAAIAAVYYAVGAVRVVRQ